MRVVAAGSRNAAGSAAHLRATRPQKASSPPQHEHSPQLGGAWRLFDVTVPLDSDAGKDSHEATSAVLAAAAARLGVKALDKSHVTVVRKSLDARQRRTRQMSQPAFSYVVDVQEAAVKTRRARAPLVEQAGRLERVTATVDVKPHGSMLAGASEAATARLRQNCHVVVVGGGPAGLFAALRLAESGVRVTLLERGQPVEQRGKAIGRLFVRRQLDSESNLCFGEGGAGTWSDGKLTTRIGRNSEAVRGVLSALVDFGAPDHILTDGKPHLGTDRLVRMLRALRDRLQECGAVIQWACRVDGLALSTQTQPQVAGVRLADGQQLSCDAVVLAVGHSARDLYRSLYAQGVPMEALGCSVGFRIEQPQSMVDSAQYGDQLASMHVLRGQGKLPVADYRLVSRPLDGGETRQAYTFCQCPGGQIVPTSTHAEELCVNGMSFSKRQSAFANSGLVVPVTPADYAPYAGPGSEALAGIEFQRAMERAAAVAGGGNLVCPVQTADAFLAEERPSVGAAQQMPASSYRLGVRHAPEGLHSLYPQQVTRALAHALVAFDKVIPGYASHKGLLHGVETRTSAPVRIIRGEDFQSPGIKGLYPIGEGAGYAGGIVSAAVDGTHAADALMAAVLGIESRAVESRGALGLTY